MLRRYAMALGCALLLISGCGHPTHSATVVAQGTPESHQQIVNGKGQSSYQGHEHATDVPQTLDAVAKLSFVNENTMCSGTLIAPDTVLTAAHCLPQAWHLGGGVQRLAGSQRIEVRFLRGTKVFQRNAHAVAVHAGYHGLLRCAHPVGLMEHKACESFARQCGALSGDAQDFCLSALDKQARRGLGLDRLWPTHDVAVVFLEKAISEIAPAQIVDDHCCSDLVRKHAPVLVAGFGQQGDTHARPSFAGIKQHGHNHIVEVGKGELRIDGGDKAHPCFGDSGGPAFAQIDHDGEASFVQVGIASRVWDYHRARGCASGLAYVRVDDEGGFIGDSLRDACIEGARQHCGDSAPQPKLAPREWHEHASCAQGSGSWSLALVVMVWLAARRRMHRAA